MPPAFTSKGKLEAWSYLCAAVKLLCYAGPVLMPDALPPAGPSAVSVTLVCTFSSAEKNVSKSRPNLCVQGRQIAIVSEERGSRGTTVSCSPVLADSLFIIHICVAGPNSGQCPCHRLIILCLQQASRGSTAINTAVPHQMRCDICITSNSYCARPPTAKAPISASIARHVTWHKHRGEDRKVIPFGRDVKGWHQHCGPDTPTLAPLNIATCPEPVLMRCACCPTLTGSMRPTMPKSMNPT